MGAIAMFFLNKGMQIATQQLRKASPKKIGVLKLSQQKIGQWNWTIGNWTHQICLILVDGSEIPFPTTVWMYPQTSVDNGREINYQPQQVSLPDFWLPPTGMGGPNQP